MPDRRRVTGAGAPLAFAVALWLLGCGGLQRPNLPPGACRAASDDARPWETRGHGLVVPAIAPRRGSEQPRVVIQAFSDFECPYCARAAPRLDEVLEAYGACVQVVWRNHPMSYHRLAGDAARAAMEIHAQAGDEAFWRYHDLLFADQAHLTRSDLEARAAALEEIDMERFRAALGSDRHQAILDRDRASIDAVSDRLGTPTFFVNGALIRGARSFDVFRLEVERALADQLHSEP